MRWVAVVMVVAANARAGGFVGDVGVGWQAFHPVGSFVERGGQTAQTLGPSLELGWRALPRLDIVLALQGSYSDQPLTIQTLAAPAVRYRTDDNLYVGAAVGLGTAMVESAEPLANSDATTTETGVAVELMARYVISSRERGHGFASTARAGTTLFSHEGQVGMTAAFTFGAGIGFHW